MEVLKKKRVNFPWVKTEQGRRFKCMLAIVADRRGWNKVISGDVNFNKRLKNVVKLTQVFFPEMYKTLANYYRDKGRIITEKDFIPIAMARLTFMFKLDRNEKKIIRLSEHPKNCSKLDADFKACEEIFNASKKR